MILVYKLDRFSRDKYESVVHKRVLKNHGVKVQSATEMISDTPEGILLESVIEGYNQFYSAELSQKIKRGNRMNISKGLWTGGALLYGYKVIDKKLYIDEHKADVMRKIFHDYANGKPKKEIVKELNAKGYKTKGGKPWTINNIQTGLSNKNYIGVTEKYGETFTDIYPRIIDDETFEKVQKMLETKKRLAGKQKAVIEYYLTGKIFCLHCGASMFGVSGTARNGEKKCYYWCKARAKQKACNKSNENKTELENAVIDDAIEFIEKHLDRASELLSKFHADNVTTQKIADFEKRIAMIDKEFEKLIDLALTQSGTMLAKINARAKDLELQKDDLNQELMKLRFLQVAPKTKDDYKKRLAKFTQGDKNDPQFRRRIIHGLINSVWVADGGVFAFYNMDGEKSLPLTINDVKQSLKENNINYDNLCGSNTKLSGDPSWA